MSYAQFGYPYHHPASQILVSSPPSGNSIPPNPCCESGRLVTDPVTSQSMYACQQCDTHSLVYPRLGSSVPSTPYAPYAPEQSYPTVGMGVDSPAAFYSPIGTSYVLKEGSNDVTGSWQSMQSAGYYPYDPSIAYGYGYDVNGARRKNATREATATLKAWLNEHRKNPYPTKGEKIMLAIITKMTLTQVSTWFANARRRLKKENKMTWETKGKEDDDDDDDGKLSDEEDDTKDSEGMNDNRNQISINTNVKLEIGYNDKSHEGPKDHLRDGLVGPNCLPLAPSIGSSPMTHNSSLGHIQRMSGHCDPLATTSLNNHHPLQNQPSMPTHHPLDPMARHPHQQPQHQQLPRYPLHPLDLQHDQERIKMPPQPPPQCEMVGVSVGNEGEDSDMTLQSAHARVPSSSSPSMSQNKPKIWSLADTATCKTPPTASLVPLVQNPNRGIGPSSVISRSEAQWQPSTIYQRPISSYQSSQSTPPNGNGYANPYHHQQSPVNNVSSVPLALLVHDKNQNASATKPGAINPQHGGAILNQIPVAPSGCDITSSPTSGSAVMAGGSGGGGSMRTPVINQCSNNPFNELQTDTPPQTPPNHKFPLASNSGAGGSGAYVARLPPTAGTHVGPQNPVYNSVDMYGSQRTLISRLPDFQDDNSEHVSNNFPNGQTVSHLNNMANVNDNNGVNASAAMEGTAFKPVYKNSLPNNGNLVTV